MEVCRGRSQRVAHSRERVTGGGRPPSVLRNGAQRPAVRRRGHENLGPDQRLAGQNDGGVKKAVTRDKLAAGEFRGEAVRSWAGRASRCAGVILECGYLVRHSPYGARYREIRFVDNFPECGVPKIPTMAHAQSDMRGRTIGVRMRESFGIGIHTTKTRIPNDERRNAAAKSL